MRNVRLPVASMAPSVTTNAALCTSSSRIGIQTNFPVKNLKLQKHSEPTTIVGKYPRPGSNERRSCTSCSSSVRKASIAASHSTPELPPAIPQPARLPRLQTDLPNAIGRTASAASANGLSSTPTTESEHTPKPRASLRRLSSLDNLLTYREEKERWKRASSILQQRSSATILTPEAGEEQEQPPESAMASPDVAAFNDKIHVEHAVSAAPPPTTPHKSRFRHITHEIGFCFSIAMTQFLAEYLISGFAIELPRLFSNQGDIGLGLFWPASLLSLVLSATLLIFARLSDLYGGYPSFMFGAIWLTIWSVIPAFCHSQVMIDISRAMEGLALAAFMPSTFAMVATVYEEGPRKNFVIGLYSGCAPLGFFAGFLVAGALPQGKTYWFFFGSRLCWPSRRLWGLT
ncbi:hypothetical protein KC315_g3900 [Hortaea werneckii]|nr:hypothetical protein KC315_g3900 [Hortaea werneckii]